MRYTNFHIINAALANTTINSAAVQMDQIFKMSAQIIVTTGSPTGTLKFQVSNDLSNAGNLPTPFVPTNWSDLGTATTISGAGVSLVAQQDMCYRWIRAVYTDGSSGTSTSLITVNMVCLSI